MYSASTQTLLSHSTFGVLLVTILEQRPVQSQTASSVGTPASTHGNLLSQHSHSV